MSELTYRDWLQGDVQTPVTREEIYESVAKLRDPEYPCSLEDLSVVQPELLTFEDNCVTVTIVPTVPHCSQATVIGLTIRNKLAALLPADYRTVVRVKAGTHNSEKGINKQLADKERVAAALQNQAIFTIVKSCSAGSFADRSTLFATTTAAPAPEDELPCISIV